MTEAHKVYAIATETHETYGHGDSGTEYKIEQADAYHKEGWWRPVFTTRKGAETYLEDSEISFKHRMKVVSLCVLGD